MRSRGISKFVVLSALLTLAFAGAAFAQTAPTQQVYGNPAGDVLGNVTTGGQDDVIPPPGGGTAPADDDEVPVTTPRRESGVDETPVPSAGGDLPFTGFEAALVAMAGLALLGTGLAVRRATRPGAAA